MTMFVLILLFARIFVLCHSLPEPERGPCEGSWVDGSLVSMGCLLFHTKDYLTWDDAAAFCLTQHQGAKLVAIETEQQMQFLSLVLGFLGHHNWWTSGTDRGREGEWYWASTLAEVGGFIWPVDEPNEGIDANCLNLRFTSGGNYEGYDQQCDSLHLPICQINH